MVGDLGHCRDAIRKLENEAFFVRRRLENHCPDHFASIQLHANFQAKVHARRSQSVHSVKLGRLSEKARPYRPQNKTTVYNLSTHKVDSAEASVLELGLNFNVAPAPDVRKVVCAVECAVNQVDPSRRDEARTRAIGVLSGLHRRKFVSPLSADERKAVKRLQANTGIVILPADKGNATVLIDTTVYKSKVLALLDDLRPTHSGSDLESAEGLTDTPGGCVSLRSSRAQVSVLFTSVP